MTPTANPVCLLCGSKDLISVAGFERLSRVTSDCRPWPAGGEIGLCAVCGGVQKPLTPGLMTEIGQVYDGYEIHPVSQGAEQPIFSVNGRGRPRSQVLLDWLRQTIHLKSDGRLLDIGCGNGAALKTWSDALPRWQLHGFEIGSISAILEKRLPQLAGLHTGPLNEIGHRFDVILLIHSLEHMTNPVQTLIEARGLLAEGGVILIQVPNLLTSPFDIMITDHVTHFRPRDLITAAHGAGLTVLGIRDDVVAKELTMLCATTGEQTATLPEVDSAAFIMDRIAWLTRMATAAQTFLAQAPTGAAVGVFGTANAAAWLAGTLEQDINFFVDEDELRVGQTFLGRPVLAPSGLPHGAQVVMPLPRSIAEAIQRRYQHLDVTFMLPPEQSGA